MKTKLTLHIDKRVIERAKAYAKSQNASLSQLIEHYLISLTKDDKSETKVSPLVESLTGVFPAEEDTTINTEYYEYLKRKYS